jgi:hypothetical protein
MSLDRRSPHSVATRRTFVKLLSLAAGAGLLAACSPSAPAQPTAAPAAAPKPTTAAGPPATTAPLRGHHRSRRGRDQRAQAGCCRRCGADQVQRGAATGADGQRRQAARGSQAPA